MHVTITSAKNPRIRKKKWGVHGKAQMEEIEEIIDAIVLSSHK